MYRRVEDSTRGQVLGESGRFHNKPDSEKRGRFHKKPDVEIRNLTRNRMWRRLKGSTRS
jgi:hypothetical protein